MNRFFWLLFSTALLPGASSAFAQTAVRSLADAYALALANNGTMLPAL